MIIFKEDITCNCENIKISFYNDINNRDIPRSVTYTASCVLSSDSCVEEFESVPFPCDCDDNCSSNCSCSGSSVFLDNKLRDSYNNDTDKPIIECSSLCSCQTSCVNRVAQHGITFSLQVFMTDAKGFGVRTLDFIPKLSFVCEYAGEIIDATEAEQRLKSQKLDAVNYIYILREYGGDKANCTRTIIDPTFVGNVGRYINHSCSSNLISVPIRANSMIPKICFFANCDIKPLQELTYNYGGFIKNEDPSLPWIEQNDLSCARTCLCKSEKCAKFLPFNKNLFD